MRRIPQCAGAAVGALILILAGHTGLAAQDTLARAETLVEQARTDANRFLQTKDALARNATGRAVGDAEKLLKGLLKADASCERCEVALVSALYVRAVVGLSRNYRDCLEEAAKGLARFPANGHIALFQGMAHYYSGDFAAAIRSLKRYQGSPSRTAEGDAAATPILQDSQQRFLGTWYRQASFYQSPESRLTRVNPQTFATEVTFQVTPEWELAVANQLAPSLAQQGPAVSDQTLVGYLDQLVARLVKGSPGPTFSYRTSVYGSEAVNASAMPGQIAVSTGMLQFVESEAELAGVLAHELAHIYAHHAARTVIKQYQAQNLVASLAQAVNPQGAVAQSVTGIAAGLGLALFQRAYSRFEENEADLYGAHILYNGGYNPTAMSQVQLRMYQRNPSQPLKFLSTHPPAPDRIETLTTYLEAFALDRELALDSATFHTIVKRQTAAGAKVAPSVPRAAGPSAIPAVTAAAPTGPTVTAAPPRTAQPTPATAPQAPPAPSTAQLPPARVPDASQLPPVTRPAAPAPSTPRADLPPVKAPAAAASAPGPVAAAPPANPAARPAAPNAGANQTSATRVEATGAPASGAPSLAASASADLLMAMRGRWTTRDGNLTVEFSRMSGQLVGFVQRVSGSWLASHVEPGEQFFKAGRAVGPQQVGGESFAVAPAGCEMSIRYKYGPATLTLDPASKVLTMQTSELRASAPPSCQWTDQIESKTYTFHRAPAR